MERSKYLVILIFLLFIFPIFSQDKIIIYDSFINNKMENWKKLIDNLQKKENKSDEQLLELLNYQYGYVAWCLGNDKKDIGEDYLDIADENLEILEKKKYKLSMIYSYKAAFYGYRIGISKWKAPFIGPKSESAANSALKSDPNNWFAYLQMGNIKYYTPKIFGGSKADALVQYLKALELLENQPQLLDKNWNYISLLTTIAQAYESIEKFSEAKKFYEKILKIEPNFTWVKNELFPNLIKKL